jgi:hypothetical protein
MQRKEDCIFFFLRGFFYVGLKLKHTPFLRIIIINEKKDFQTVSICIVFTNKTPYAYT